MKTKLLALLVAISLGQFAISAQAQIAGAQPLGTTTVGTTAETTVALLNGWSVKKSILNKPVFNETGARVGVIHDLIVAPDASVSFAIVAAGQFAGVSRHDVAIPVDQLDIIDGKIVLAGATKAAIKALPEFEYAKLVAVPKPRKDYMHH